MIPLRLLCLAGTLALLSGPALAGPTGSAPAPSAAPAVDAGPVSTASESTDAKIAAWLNDSAPPQRTGRGRGPDPDPRIEAPRPKPDRKIHGEFGAAIGSGGYRSAYGVATIPLGKSTSATVAFSTARGPWPLVAGGPWYAGPAGPGIDAGCVCREAPDGSEICRPTGAATRLDADMADAACPGP